jgi:hypothetical protein
MEAMNLPFVTRATYDAALASVEFWKTRAVEAQLATERQVVQVVNAIDQAAETIVQAVKSQ